MPARSPTINLLGNEDLAHTPWGRILSWATTYGRYIMITTEIIVLLAFISRFSLDRKLTDLKEEISQKQAIIEANADFETEFLKVQNKLQTIKTLAADQKKLPDLLSDLVRFLPPDVYFVSLTITEGSINAKTTALTTPGFAQFLNRIVGSSRLRNIEISEIKKNPVTGIQFQLTATIPKQTSAR